MRPSFVYGPHINHLPVPQPNTFYASMPYEHGTNWGMNRQRSHSLGTEPKSPNRLGKISEGSDCYVSLSDMWFTFIFTGVNPLQRQVSIDLHTSNTIVEEGTAVSSSSTSGDESNTSAKKDNSSFREVKKAASLRKKLRRMASISNNVNKGDDKGSSTSNVTSPVFEASKMDVEPVRNFLTTPEKRKAELS